MLQEVVHLPVTVSSLIEAAGKLSVQEKFRLWQFLEEQLAQAEETSFENDPRVLAEIREAKAAYRVGLLF